MLDYLTKLFSHLHPGSECHHDWEAKLFSSVAIPHHVVSEVDRGRALVSTLTPVASWSAASPEAQLSIQIRGTWAFFMPGGNLMPRSAMRLSNLATGQLAGRPVFHRIATPSFSCSSWGEGVAITRRRTAGGLSGSMALRFGQPRGGMVHVHGGRDENNCVSLLIADTRMPTAGVEPAVQATGWALYHRPTGWALYHRPTGWALYHRPTGWALYHHPTGWALYHRPTGWALYHRPTGNHHHPAGSGCK